MRPWPIALFCLAAFAIGCGPKTAPAEPEAHEDEHAHAEGTVEISGEAPKTAGIEISEAGMTAISGTRLTGQVEPNPNGLARVSSPVAGKVSQILVQVGDSVSSGQLLAVVASSQLASAQADYSRAIAEKKLADQTFARQRKLANLGEFGRPALEEARRAVTDAEAELSKVKDELADERAGLAQSDAAIVLAQSELKQAETERDVARKVAERAEALFRDQIISRQDWERAQADARNAEAMVIADQAKVREAERGREAAQAKVNLAQGKMGSAETRLASFRQSLAREEQIYQGGFRTGREVQEAEAAVSRAQISVKSAADQVRLLGGSPGAGGSVSVRAPFSGRVTKLSLTRGQVVTAEAELVELVNLKTVWVQLNAFEAMLASLQKGQRINLSSDSNPDRTFTGVIDHIGDTIDAENRTARVRVVVENAEGGLRPGSFVSASLQGLSSESAVFVPLDAVQDIEGDKVVFVPTDEAEEHTEDDGHEHEEGDGHDHDAEEARAIHFKMVKVQTGRERGDLIEIVSGLNPGDRFVSKGAFTIKAQLQKSELGHGHAH